MLSYRHGFHAGNHADVLKHIALVALLRLLTRKDKPVVVVDTHAGAGMYSLEQGFAVRNAEFRNGIAVLWERNDLPEPVADYLDQVRAVNPDGVLRQLSGVAPDCARRAPAAGSPAAVRVAQHRAADSRRAVCAGRSPRDGDRRRWFRRPEGGAAASVTSRTRADRSIVRTRVRLPGGGDRAARRLAAVRDRHLRRLVSAASASRSHRTARQAPAGGGRGLAGHRAAGQSALARRAWVSTAAACSSSTRRGNSPSRCAASCLGSRGCSRRMRPQSFRIDARET